MGSCQAEKSGESTTGRRSSICKMHGEMKPCRELRGWEELQEVRLGSPVEMRWLNAAGRIPGYRVWIYCLVDTEEPLSIFKQAGNLISFFFFLITLVIQFGKPRRVGPFIRLFPEYILSMVTSWVLGYGGQCRCGPSLSFHLHIFSLFSISRRSWPPPSLLYFPL